ncbi:hypothetical protein VaNZ11_004178 [Volvox africanus]|uniref:BSD domain-containing protein n=1 Tax=Volvox africanus TaxID=51714 RepID=A0ABQ5RVZ1_9CHLO|nr:hypothetical protein VaNZ11_004178 [Volvox africanus]
MYNAHFTEEAGQSEKSAEPALKENKEHSITSTTPNPLLNFWSVAAAVTNTVKARADELVKSVVDTDWRTELSQFSREVGEESKTLKEKTAELVEHLPEQVVHLPEKAEEALHHLPAQVQLPKEMGQTLEGVGVAFAQFGKSLLQGTKELIDELKEGVETEIAVASREGKRVGRGKSANSPNLKLSSVTAKYSRFEAEVAAMQRDSSTYCDEPENGDDYARWRAGFSIEGVKADIARILSDNAFMTELQSRLVPIIVEYDDFWHRYFYRLHKLQQKEEQRQQLTQRAKTLQEDDVPLGWGDDDEVQLSPSEPDRQGLSCAAGPNVPVSEVPSTPGREASTKDDCPKPAESRSTDTPGKELQGVEPAAMVMMVPAAAGLAALASPTAAAKSTGGERKSHSGGGVSTSGISGGTLVADAGPLEAEPHVETSSDSSAKEWCVVSSNTQHVLSPAEPAATTESQEEPAAAQPSGSSLVESGGEPTARSSEANTPVPNIGTSTMGHGSATEEKARVAAEKADRAKQAAADGVEEELDEDWGNWD